MIIGFSTLARNIENDSSGRDYKRAYSILTKLPIIPEELIIYEFIAKNGKKYKYTITGYDIEKIIKELEKFEYRKEDTLDIGYRMINICKKILENEKESVK